ncbi:MAG: helix-turn-helix domain-containing protein [Myxococcales bacterium]|nr:helix-turn-helix domain-containing protein [Myxococcales bacterium]
MQRGLSVEQVAKVTKIQPRILERLEAGRFEGLPAEVFVRGFVRSFARCVGLDEDEALRRYGACGLANGTADLTPTVRALVEAMVDLAPGSVGTPRATPRRMQAVQPVEGPEMVDLGSPGMSTSGAVVETMMLPETGTVVMPAQLAAMVAEAAPSVCEPVVSAPSTLPAGSFDALPVARLSAEMSVVIVEAPDARLSAEMPVAIVDEPVASEPGAPIAVAVEPVALAAVVSDGSKKKRGRRGKGRNKRATDAPAGISRELLATGTPSAASPVVVASLAAEPSVASEPSVTSESTAPSVSLAEPIAAVVERAVEAACDEPIAMETWAPKMPPIAAPSVPWRKPAYAASTAVVVPSLVIDDADPDSAERVLEARAETLAPRRSFLPPILLDREDRSTRQGGLTLAVIILLIAATLTLSYLMRRPSASGDGMTRLETPAAHVTTTSLS